MKNRSLLSEARQIELATELVRLGARLQLLESETSLSRERLVRLYKELKGVSPPKGMLPYSTEWFGSWQPNFHSSLFVGIHRFLVKHTDSRGVDALVRSYKLYREHVAVNGLECVLSLTRAWTLLRFMERRLLRTTPCTKCGGEFVVHALDLSSNHVCGLCHVPSRAGKGRRQRPCPATVRPAARESVALSAARPVEEAYPATAE